MQRYDIHYLPIAEEDLNEIVDYLLEHSITAANRFIDELDELEESLSMFPELGTLSRDKKLRSRGYHMLVINDYLLFYTIRHDRVYVMRVIHGKRNYLPLLNETERKRDT
ncbi:MAG: type II toxin-antitoxin system RelE/ParE family toxin [Defluviitaleaceae bacterium]|nr:type II toxin-antitoxin system RelE/ParE family toxin [Defluviitaleaceae bacterium]